MSEKYKKVLELDNEIEAKLVESILKEENIPHIMKTHYDLAYDGIYQAHHGWGFIMAPPSYEEKINDIYNNLKQDKNND